MAAVAGVDPWPLTLAELQDAYYTKRDYDWDHSAYLCMHIRNSITGKACSLAEFHLYRDNVPTPANVIDPAAEHERLTRAARDQANREDGPAAAEPGSGESGTSSNDEATCIHSDAGAEADAAATKENE